MAFVLRCIFDIGHQPVPIPAQVSHLLLKAINLVLFCFKPLRAVLHRALLAKDIHRFEVVLGHNILLRDVFIVRFMLGYIIIIVGDNTGSAMLTS
jgi:hypothetical protein